MKKFMLFSSLLLFFFIGCSKSDNPVETNNQNNNNISGTWKLSYYSSDSLIVNLDIDGSNNILAGKASLESFFHKNSFRQATSSTGNISGTYTDSTLVANANGFTFAGFKTGSDYTGAVTYVYNFYLSTDTLYIQNATLVKQ